MSEHEYDKTTGMPVVPENYYWQVDVVWEDYMTVPTAFVKLRKRRSWLVVVSDSVLLGKLDPRDVEAGRTKQDRRYDYVKIDPSEYAHEVAWLAGKVLDKYANQLEFEMYHARFKSEAKRLSGKYPPKSLNQ